MRKTLIAMFCLSSLGCGLFGNEPESTVQNSPSSPGFEAPDPDLIKKFNKGVAALDSEDYKAAEVIFTKILAEHPTSRFELIVQYNLAASFEGQNQCKKAGQGYRKVARSSLGKYKRLEAQALYRLSFAYTCVGADAKAVVSLLDARRRRQSLQDEVAKAEIPARLASAYARLGNNEKAKAFYDEARRGIQYLRSQYKNRRSLNDILAKTLFLMGRIAPIEQRIQSNSTEYLNGLEYLQSYLLESVEMNSEKWSTKAASQIQKAYQLVSDELKKPITAPYKTDEQKRLRRNYKMASEALSRLQILKKDMRASSTPNEISKELLQDLLKKEKGFEQYLASNANFTPLTKSSSERQGLKRKARMVPAKPPKSTPKFSKPEDQEVRP